MQIVREAELPDVGSHAELEAWPPTGVYFHDPVELPDYPFARPEAAEAPIR